MSNQTIEIKGIVTALSPVCHSEILPQCEEKSAGSDYLMFRRYPFILKDADGQPTPQDVYTVSGNSMRGIGRQLLYQHTFEDVLDIDFAKILPDVKPIDRHYLVSLFAVGGVTPKNSKQVGFVSTDTYDKVLECLPTLDLLGGVLITHHFNSSASIGNLFLRTKETEQLFAIDHHIFQPATETLPSLVEIVSQDVRHTRTESAKAASTKPPVEETKDAESLKTKMIYGANVLPAGSSFYWRSFCHTQREGTALAFNAMIALLTKHGSIGGQGGKGYGRVTYAIPSFDANEAVKAYDKYLLEHKDEFLGGIRLLASEFRYTIKEKKDEGEDKNKEKKTAKRKK